MPRSKRSKRRIKGGSFFGFLKKAGRFIKKHKLISTFAPGLIGKAAAFAGLGRRRKCRGGALRLAGNGVGLAGNGLGLAGNGLRLAGNGKRRRKRCCKH